MIVYKITTVASSETRNIVNAMLTVDAGKRNHRKSKNKHKKKGNTSE